ncbi:Calpain-like protein, partial [Hondaea fermentalgiana]
PSMESRFRCEPDEDGSYPCSVRLAVSDWIGSFINVYVAKIFIEEFLGYPVEITADSSDYTGTVKESDTYASNGTLIEPSGMRRMSSGEIDVILEYWPSGHRDNIREFVVEKSTIKLAGENGIEGRIGWFMPSFVGEDNDPALDYWRTLTDPTKASLFPHPAATAPCCRSDMDQGANAPCVPTESLGGTKVADGGMANATAECDVFSDTAWHEIPTTGGRFLGGKPTWTTHDDQIIRNLGLPLTLVLAVSESKIMEEIEKAHASRTPLLFYFWKPHGAFRMYDLDDFLLPLSSAECRSAQTSGDADCGYPIELLAKAYSVSLEQSKPDVAHFVESMVFNSTVQQEEIHYELLVNSSRTLNEAACEWVKINEQTWRAWTESVENQYEGQTWQEEILEPTVMACDCKPDGLRDVVAVYDTSAYAEDGSVIIEVDPSPCSEARNVSLYKTRWSTMLLETEDIWEVTNATGLVAAIIVTLVLYIIIMIIMAKTRFRWWMLPPVITARRKWLMPWIDVRDRGASSLRTLHYSIIAWKGVVKALLAALAVSVALMLYYSSSDSVWGNFRQKPLALVSLGLYLLTVIALVLFWKTNLWNISMQIRVLSFVPLSLNLMDTKGHSWWAPQEAREKVLRQVLAILISLGLIFVTITNLFLIPFGECEGEDIAWMFSECNKTWTSHTRAAHDNYMQDATWHVGSNWIFILFNSIFVIMTAFLIDLYVHAGVDLVVEVQTRVAQSLMRYGVNAHQIAMAATETDDATGSLASARDIDTQLNERAPTAQERVDVLMNMDSPREDSLVRASSSLNNDDEDRTSDAEDRKGGTHSNDNDGNASPHIKKADWDALPGINAPIRVPLSSPDGRELIDKELARAYKILKNFVWKQMGDMPGLQRGDAAVTIEGIARQESLHRSVDKSRPPARVIRAAKPFSEQNYMDKLLHAYMGILRAGMMISYGASVTVLLMHAVLHLVLTQRTVAFFQAVGILMTDSILLLRFAESTKMRTKVQASSRYARISRAKPWHIATISLLSRIVLVSVPSDAWFIGQACLYTIASIYLGRGLASEYMSKKSTGGTGRRTVLRAVRRVRGVGSLFRVLWLSSIVFLREILFAVFLVYFGGLTWLLSSPTLDNAMRLGVQENNGGYVTIWILEDAVPQYKIGVLALLIVCNFCAGFLAWHYWLRIRGKRPLHVLSNLRLATQVLLTFSGVLALAIYSAYFISYDMFAKSEKFSIFGTVATMLPVTFVAVYVHEIWVRDDFRYWHPLPKRVILPASAEPYDEHTIKLRNYAAKVKAARQLIWRRNAVVVAGSLFVISGFAAWGASLAYEIEDLDTEFAILFPCATFALLCGVLGAKLWFNTLQVSSGLVFFFALLVSTMLASYVVGLEEVITSRGTAYNDFLDVIGFFLLLVPVFITGVGSMLVFRDEHFKLNWFVVAAATSCLLILLGLGSWFAIRFSAFAAIFYYLCLVIVFVLACIWLWWHSSRIDSDKSLRPTRRWLWVVVVFVIVLCALGAWDLGTQQSVIIADVSDPLYGVSYFLVAYALAFVFTTVFILSINRDLVRKSTRLSPAPSLLGLPAIAFKVENRGGELYKYNSPVLWVIGVLFSLQLLGFSITWTVQPNAGISMTSVAICLLEIYALHMSVERSLHFRSNLLEIDDVSELDTIFERILRESVDRCLQISQQAMMASWLQIRRPRLDETNEGEGASPRKGAEGAQQKGTSSLNRPQGETDDQSAGEVRADDNNDIGEEQHFDEVDADADADASAEENEDEEQDEEQEGEETIISNAKALVEYYDSVAECDAEYERFLHDGCKYDALFNVLFWMRTTQVVLEQRATCKRVVWTPLTSTHGGDSVSTGSGSSGRGALQIRHSNSHASPEDAGILDDTRKVIPPSALGSHSHAERVPYMGNSTPYRLPSLEVNITNISSSQEHISCDASVPSAPASLAKSTDQSTATQAPSTSSNSPATSLSTLKNLKFWKGGRGPLRAASRRSSSTVARTAADLRNAGRLRLAQTYSRGGLRTNSELNVLSHEWKHLDDDMVWTQLQSIVQHSGRWSDPEFPATNASLFLDWNDEDYEEYLDDLDEDDIRGAVWCRPSEFLPNEVARVMNLSLCVKPSENVYDPTEVLQGGTGDCWLLSAMSVVALFPRLLDDVVVTKHVAEKGIYHVRLFLDGKWENILIDDRFPCSLEQSLEFDPNDESKSLRLSDRPPDIVLKRPHDDYDPNEVRRLPLPQYCRSRTGNVLWPMLIEKAYAKRFGSYEALNGGHVHSALVDLTGGLSQVFALHEDVEVVMSGALWDKLLEFKSRGALLAAGSPAPPMGDSNQFADGQLATDRNGIVHGHAYSIVDVMDESDYNGKHKLLRLRDPWGISRWNGPWSRKDRKRWTRRMQRRLKYEVDAASRVDGLREILTQMESEDDANEDPLGSLPTGFESDNTSRPFGSPEEGDFWISLEDFVARFQWLYVCQIFDKEKWVHRSISDEWKGFTAGGPPNQPGAYYNPQYGFRLQESAARKLAPHRALGCGSGKLETVTVFFSISNLQESQSSHYRSSGPLGETDSGGFSGEPTGIDPFGQYEDAARESGRIYPFMSLLLLNIDGKRLNGELAANSVVASTGKYKDSRDLSFETKLPCTSDITYTIFPSLFPRGKEGAFRINIYCETGFELFRLPMDESAIA